MIKEDVAGSPHHTEQTALLFPRREGEFRDRVACDGVAEEASSGQQMFGNAQKGAANAALDAEERQRVAVLEAADQSLAARIDEDLLEGAESRELGRQVENGRHDGGVCIEGRAKPYRGDCTGG